MQGKCKLSTLRDAALRHRCENRIRCEKQEQQRIAAEMKAEAEAAAQAEADAQAETGLRAQEDANRFVLSEEDELKVVA